MADDRKLNNLMVELREKQEELLQLRVIFFEELHKSRNGNPPKVEAQQITDSYAVYMGDCTEVLRGIPSDSIHYTIFSPPFSSLFTYSASLRDLGNSTEEQFFRHFSFSVPEMYRVTLPGRLLTIHCSDLPAQKEKDGYIGNKDFPGVLVRMFEREGFIYHSKHIIWKDPLVEATRTKALGLLHKQLCKDSAMCRAGGPDYLITFRKPGDNPIPVHRKRGFEKYIGERPEPKAAKVDDPMKNKYSHEVWQRYASPVWFDIKQGDTLNVRLAREKEDERHICPLQLQVIERCLELWTNPGDIVASWFAGIGSEGYVALKAGRRFVGVELKPAYYKIMVRNLEKVLGGPAKKRGFFFDKAIKKAVNADEEGSKLARL